MQRCLELALLAPGNVAPNPMVGAVLVHDDKVIGEGYHQQYGHAHAEVNCINSVPEQLKHLIEKSTLYVSLEPCTHFGKTPPCADLIIKHKIPNVVIGCRDSFAKVNGSGISKLKEAGINVLTGIKEQEALELNKRFFTFHEEKRPYIILKWAQSADKKIANADRSPVKISNDISNHMVHKWRSEEAAIIVGTNTALNDDPSLTTRLWPGKDPVRIVVDKYLQIPEGFHLLDRSTPTIIINTVKQEEDGNNNYYKVGEDENIIGVILSLLWQRNLTSLIVEGGTVLLQSFIDASCWDEARVISNMAMELKDGYPAPVLSNEQMVSKENMAGDEIIFYRNKSRKVK